MKILKKENVEGINFKSLILEPGEEINISGSTEKGIILLEGEINIILNQRNYSLKRKNVFNQKGGFIHLNNVDECNIEAKYETKLLILKVENHEEFKSKIYMPEDISESLLESETLEGKDTRTIRNIVDMGTEPNANIIIGEVIADAGCWSSYPPHSHEQPELYYYLFDYVQGFGVSIVGDEAKVVRHDDLTIIPGNLIHPQSSAPGYKMFYVWIIRNLENNPWTKREYDPKHKHLLEEK